MAALKSLGADCRAGKIGPPSVDIGARVVFHRWLPDACSSFYSPSFDEQLGRRWLRESAKGMLRAALELAALEAAAAIAVGLAAEFVVELAVPVTIALAVEEWIGAYLQEFEELPMCGYVARIACIQPAST